MIKNLLPLLKAGNAHIVNITSMGGYLGSAKFNGLSHYSASKAALAILTECCAEEYKNDHLSFNALALGSVQTEMLGEAFPGYKAPVNAEEMGEFIANFAINGNRFFNGKVLPVSMSIP
jgi:NAD(P)-dependent dehydrogenase (short-subunit alcohol dehydrogenase family)